MAGLIPFVAALVSGTLLAFAFPPLDQDWLVWFGLVPFLSMLLPLRAGRGFMVSLVCGVTFFAVAFNWVFEVEQYLFFHHVILGIYLGFFSGIFGAVFCFIARKRGAATALLAAPFVWITLEFLRSNLGFMAFPYGWLGYSQHARPWVIQIAAITGTYGLTWLVVLANAGLTAIALSYGQPRGTASAPQDNAPSRSAALRLSGFAAICLAFVVAYGAFTVSRPLSGKRVRVSVVQGSIPQERKWDPKYAPTILQIYEDLTREAARTSPELIVWPEAATPSAITLDSSVYQNVRRIATAAAAPLLIGSASHQKFPNRKTREIEYLNSAFLISPNPKVKPGRYDKIHLLPFGEYLPFREAFPWSWVLVPQIGTTLPGTEFTVFREPLSYPFSATICWENIFPDGPRGFVRNGAQFLINVTNEAWFGRSVGPQHYLISSIFRAVENRVPVVRCANTGISCFIDPYGRVLDQVKDAAGQNLFVRGFATGEIEPMAGKTFYTRFGDWWAWFCVLSSCGFLGRALIRRKEGTQPPMSVEAMCGVP